MRVAQQACACHSLMLWTVAVKSLAIKHVYYQALADSHALQVVAHGTAQGWQDTHLQDSNDSTTTHSNSSNGADAVVENGVQHAPH